MPIPSCKSRSPRAARSPRGPRGPRSPLDTRSRSALLREFLLHLASERGLAENTLHAYRRDLELLYGCGLRATELCDLGVRDVNLQVGCVRVLGKGRKERIVPLGRAVNESMIRYLADCRPNLLKQPTERLFLSRSGKPMERIA